MVPGNIQESPPTEHVVSPPEPLAAFEQKEEYEDAKPQGVTHTEIETEEEKPKTCSDKLKALSCKKDGQCQKLAAVKPCARPEPAEPLQAISASDHDNKALLRVRTEKFSCNKPFD